ncbi:MAG TPA: hypothetical protein VMA13_10070 [Candidatus Saccharimonadales bacterium]|nr:hypothetical protein [Candidatus Saccharimonadales bacterium]
MPALDFILSTAEAKTAASVPQEAVPEPKAAAEEFNAVIERIGSGWLAAISAGKSNPEPLGSLGSSQEKAENRSDKPSKTNGSKATQDSSQPPAEKNSEPISSSSLSVSPETLIPSVMVLPEVGITTVPVAKTTATSSAPRTPAQTKPVVSGINGMKGAAIFPEGSVVASPKYSPVALSLTADDAALANPALMTPTKVLSEATITSVAVSTPRTDSVGKTPVRALAETEVGTSQTDSRLTQVPNWFSNKPAFNASQDESNGAGDTQPALEPIGNKITNPKDISESTGTISISDTDKSVPPYIPVAANQILSAAEFAGQNFPVKSPFANAISKNQVGSPSSQTAKTPKITDGTAAAQQEMPMKMAPKQNKFTGATEQKLPGSSTLTGGQNMPSLKEHTIAPATAQTNNSFTPIIGASVVTDNISTRMNSAGVLNLPSASLSSPQAVERTQDLITMHTVQLRESGANSLQVVIKPDAGLQLSLQLQQRDGGIDVQARVDHGDYNLLSQHWGELQQQLDSRGIRVAPLSNPESFFGSGGESYQQPPKSHGQLVEEEITPTGTYNVVASGYSPTAATMATPASTTLSRHWESWA